MASRVLEGFIVIAAIIVAGLLAQRSFGSSSRYTAVPGDSSSATVQSEVVLLYIGSPDCSVCVSSEFIETLELLLAGFGQEVAHRGARLRAVGIMVTKNIPQGYEYLRKYGTWDEIAIGGGWANTQLELNLWNLASPPVTPQIVTFGRVVHSSANELLFTDQSRKTVMIGASTLRAIALLNQWDRLMPPEMRSPPQVPKATSATGM